MYKINKVFTDKYNFLQMMQGIANMPKSLYLLGNVPERHVPTVAIIGTRKPTAYGQEATYRISYDLAKAGVVIVSGLALGVDAIAHKAALDAGGITLAIMPGGLNRISPRTNLALAKQIISSGGALISEHPPGFEVYKGSFVARNRIVAGIANGVLVTEAAIKSGTAHTVGFALNFGRPVMAVPGNITNPMSSGANNLIKTGARLISDAQEVLEEIGVRSTGRQQAVLPLAESPEEAVILQVLVSGVQDGEELQRQSKLEPALFNQTLTMLEITQKIRPLGGNKWSLV
jgi:DNA processing protein